MFQFGKIQRKYWESPQKWLPFPFKIETCLQEHLFTLQILKLPWKWVYNWLEVKLIVFTEITQERVQNFWSLNNTGDDSEFLILQTTQEFQNFCSPTHQRRGYRISEPPNNTGDSEFLIPHTPQERIQNFWSPNNTGDSEFLIPQTIHIYYWRA